MPFTILPHKREKLYQATGVCTATTGIDDTLIDIPEGKYILSTLVSLNAGIIDVTSSTIEIVYSDGAGGNGASNVVLESLYYVPMYLKWGPNNKATCVFSTLINITADGGKIGAQGIAGVTYTFNLSRK